MSQPGMVSHGLPPRDNDVQRELRDLRRRLNHLHGTLVAAVTREITANGGIIINGGALQSLFDDGLFSLRVGTFDTFDDSLNPATVTGIEVDKDDTYSAIGRPEVQKPSMRAYTDTTSGATSFWVSADNVQMWRMPGGEIRIAGNGTNQFALLDSSGNVILSPDTGANVRLQVGTTANTANTYLDPTTSNVLRSTSSRRYKQDIVDANLDPDVLLELTPRRFRAKTEVETQGDDAPEHVGFIAEEAAGLGLDDFVTHDEVGPEAFSYAGYVVGLQAIVRHQAKQIESLSARLERLEQAEPHEEG